MDGSSPQQEPEGGNGALPLVSLGRYEVLGKLGTGGMATVYLARTAGEAGFQRLFAIKVLHPHLSEDVGFIRMLLDEARIAARLHHPNVVPIVDLGIHQSIHYVAMEYIEGCSLSALLKKYREERPARLLVPIVLDTLAGLDSAHTLVDDAGKPMNLVHRDVSPQNVLVGIDGSARITDFGIARAEARINTTRPGQLKGKIAYMAPEQIRSTEVDCRADVFAVGAMLWSMLTGRRLFHGDNDAATMSNILNLEIPPASTIGLKPPAVFDEICARALERDPAKRYASAQEMEDALRTAATKADLLGSRREVAEWVTRAFKDDLASRRQAIRSVVTAERAAIAALPSLRATTEFPSFTPSMATSGPQTGPVKLVEMTEPQLNVNTSVTKGPRSRVMGMAIGAALLGVIGLWLALRSPDHAEPPPAAPATVTTTPTPSPAPAPPTVAPAVAPAVVTTAPVPAPPAPPPPAVAHAPAIAKRPPVRMTHPAPPPPKTTPVVAPPPPVTPPVSPIKPANWDKDSPLPPP